MAQDGIGQAMAGAPRRVLLGVGGGIAAYKAAELVRLLRRTGAEVRVVMTDSATQFVGPATFQALSGHPVRTSLWDAAAEAAMGHIELARWADRLLIAPATADLLARLAHGHADDLLTTLCLASDRPLAVAPAMNRLMWAHPATQANLALLRGRGVQVLGPASGEQACGETGEGRMLEPADIVARLGDRRWAGRRVLVSAGPTFEDIDPVRFIGNRSSGRMGFALAEAAARRGADVTLVAGPVRLDTPHGVARVDVRSALQMRDAVLAHIDAVDVFISAAAVADFRPATLAPDKIKKSAADASLALVPNPDILAEVGARAERPLLVGFAAETEAVLEHARDKLRRKRLDFIAANRVGLPGTGFDADDNHVTLISDEASEDIGPAPKSAVADALLDRIGRALEARA